MVLTFFKNLKSNKSNKIQPRSTETPIKVEEYLEMALTIPGWVDHDELSYKARIAERLPENAVIVEIGCFLGRSTLVMAGVRKRIGNGMVHVVDPFDASGDAFSVPFYKCIIKKMDQSILEQFCENIRSANLENFVIIHKGTAESIIKNWNTPIDMLILDGDQSQKGVKSAYELWQPFLKIGGYICLHNSGHGIHIPGHDGHRRLLMEEIKEPVYTEIHTEKKTSFARKK